MNDVEQFDVDERDAVAVRQYQYAIGKAVTPSNWLLTKNVWSCSALIGVAEGGSAFLCHLDTPRSVRVLSRLVSDLREQNLDPKSFRLYVAGGIQPVWTLGPLALVIVLAIYGHHNWLCTLSAAMWATFFNATGVWLRIQIILSKELIGGLKSKGYSRAWLGLGKRAVLVDAKTGVFQTRSYGRMEDKARFTRPKVPMKADGSA